MSGHSKWHSIKHKKAAADAKRGAAFTKAIREIIIAAKMGGSDPSANPRLRSAIQAARDISMPKENIERAIKRGAGELTGVSYEDFTFEGFGPGGVAILVEGTTDNRNRTTPEIRHLFAKHGGSLGEIGCVGWMFHKKGVLRIPAADQPEDRVMEVAIEAGAEDLINDGDEYRILTEPGALESVRQKIEAAGIRVDASKVENIPTTTVRLEADEARKLLKLIEALEDHDDVNSVSANYEIDDAVMEQLQAE